MYISPNKIYNLIILSAITFVFLQCPEQNSERYYSPENKKSISYCRFTKNSCSALAYKGQN